MINRNLIIFSIFCFAHILRSQQILPLQNACAVVYHSKLIAAGLQTEKNTTSLKIYKVSSQNAIEDSLRVKLGPVKSEDHLQLTSDTLHGYLNIYLQKKESKQVTIFRISSDFKILNEIKKVDIARLNSIADLEREIVYHRQNVYSVQTAASDSGRSQFYLNKFKLKDSLLAYEYNMVWQYPLERQFIESVHIAKADDQHVYLFVNVSKGTRAGQWLLKIAASDAKLKKAVRLSIKGNSSYYAYGNIFKRPEGKLIVAGQILDLKEIPGEQKANGSYKLYLIEMDSLMEISARTEIPLQFTLTKQEKVQSPRLLKFEQGTSEKQDQEINMVFDIYKQNKKCFDYSGTVALSYSEQIFALPPDKISVSTNTVIEKFVQSADNSSGTGNLCTTKTFPDDLFYYEPVLPVKRAFKSLNSSAVILGERFSVKSNLKTFALFNSNLKTVEQKIIVEFKKEENPTLLVLNKNTIVITNQLREQFQISFHTW